MSDAALAWMLVAAAACGLLAGSFVAVVAYRVPAGISLHRASHCPRCGARVRGWRNVPMMSWILLRGRCEHCGAPIALRVPLIEAGTAVVFVGVVGWVLVDASPLASVPEWGVALMTAAAFLYFAGVSITLAIIDVDTRRLPDAIVLPSYPIAIVLLAAVCLITGDWSPLARAAIGLMAMLVLYGVPRLIRPDGVGGGDVKLSGLIGLYLGFLGWEELVVGAFAAFLLGGAHAVVLLTTRRAGPRTLPFGPWMLAGAWIGIFAGPAIAAG